MERFSDRAEYRKEKEKMQRGTGESRPQYELVVDDNTVYEVDLTCESCLKRYRSEKEKKEKRY